MSGIHVDSYDDRAEAGLHYIQYDTPISEYARDIREAFASEDLSHLALLMRRRDATAVRDEIARIFDSYWSRQLKSRLDEERQQHEGAA